LKGKQDAFEKSNQSRRDGLRGLSGADYLRGSGDFWNPKHFATKAAASGTSFNDEALCTLFRAFLPHDAENTDVVSVPMKARTRPRFPPGLRGLLIS